MRIFARSLSPIGTPVSGSITSAATWLTRCWKSWLPPTPRKPRSLESEFMYRTAFFLSSSACCLGPFGRAQEHRFLGIPTRVDDRALGPPTLLGQSAESLGLRQQRDLSRQRVGGAEDPAVMMIAADNPLVRPGRALHRRDDVIDRLLLPVGFDRQMNHRRSWSYAIGYRQRAAPGSAERQGRATPRGRPARRHRRWAS